MDEPLAEFYLKKLEDEPENIHKTLQIFCKVLYPNIKYESEFYGRFHALINLFGYRTMFFSLLDCLNVEPKDSKHFLNLITYYAKKRLEEKYASNPSANLTSLINQIKKEMKHKDLKIPEIE